MCSLPNITRWLFRGRKEPIIDKVVVTSPITTPEQRLRQQHYVAQLGEVFNEGRFEAIRLLAAGDHSNVWLAKDRRNDSFVALKILTSHSDGTEYESFELDILKEITYQQPQVRGGEQDTHVIGLNDHFRIETLAQSHNCIVMPVMGSSLNRQAQRFPGRRIPVSLTKEITKQILTGLQYLHGKCDVVHTGIAAAVRPNPGRTMLIGSVDLRPSNVCFSLSPAQVQGIADGKAADEVTPTINTTDPSNVVIIGFGAASWTTKQLSDDIQQEHPRAPEVILGAPYGPPVDIWGLGCLVMELTKGYTVFRASACENLWTSEDDYLAQYMEALGPMPATLLQRGTKTAQYFDESGDLLRVPQLKWTSLKALVDGEHGLARRPDDMSAEEVPLFVDFLKGALVLDPHERQTATELLEHDWLKMA